MLDNVLNDKLYEAAKRENLDLNDPIVQQKIQTRKGQIESMLYALIMQHTRHCGCGKKKVEEPAIIIGTSKKEVSKRDA